MTFPSSALFNWSVRVLENTFSSGLSAGWKAIVCTIFRKQQSTVVDYIDFRWYLKYQWKGWMLFSIWIHQNQWGAVDGANKQVIMWHFAHIFMNIYPGAISCNIYDSFLLKKKGCDVISSLLTGKQQTVGGTESSNVRAGLPADLHCVLKIRPRLI